MATQTKTASKRGATTTKKTPLKQGNEFEQKPIAREVGVSHASVFDFDYCVFGENQDLKFPYSIQTYKRMVASSIAIASALNAVKVIALRVPRYVEPYDQSEDAIKKAQFVDECLGVTKDNNDMTHSFDDFLRDALTMNQFGFSIHEKVFRYRNYKYGSKYDDGLIGIKRLPIRPQESIATFEYDKHGRDLVAIKQKQSQRRASVVELIKANNGLAKIKREYFLKFNADNGQDETQSTSPLKDVYEVWRELQRYKDLENIASSKNLNGLPVLWMPAEYMTDDVDDETSLVYRTLRDGISKISIGQQTSLILPSDREDQSGSGGKLFDFSLMSASSSNITAITAIIERLENQIYQCLFADVLQMGNERGGNSNLASAKSSMLNMLVENRIKEIFTVINNDLIPDLFRRNGWDITKTPRLRYGTLKEVTMEVFAKAIQQLKATKTIAVTPKNINYIAEQIGLPERVSEDLSKEELSEILGVEDEDDSRSGDGMNKQGHGTSDKVAEDDRNAANLNKK